MLLSSKKNNNNNKIYEKRKMSNFITDEVKIVGLQTFDRYNKLNPVEISIKDSEINTFLSRSACNKYRLIINN